MNISPQSQGTNIDIEAFLCNPADQIALETLLAIASEFSAYPITIKRLLIDSSQAARALGVIRLANDLCAGAHTSAGATIAHKTLSFLLRVGTTLGLEADMLRRVEGALVCGLANALYLEGRFNEISTLVDDLSATELVEDEGYWNAASIDVRSHLRQFDLDSAIKRLASVPERFQHIVHYAMAKSDVAKACQSRFVVPPPKTAREKHVDIWRSNVADQKEKLLAIQSDLARSAPEAEHLATVEADIRAAIKELNDFSARLDELKEVASLRDEMLGTLRRFSALMLRVQNVRLDRVDTARLLMIDRVLEQAHRDLELDLVTDEDFKNIDYQLNCRVPQGDSYGRIMLLWIGALLTKETHRTAESRQRFSALLDTLQETIALCSNENDRGRLANFFYDLPAKVFELFTTTDPSQVFRAAEMRKGRSLLAMRANSIPYRQYTSEAQLGADTHYLGITVLENTSRILLNLYCANGYLANSECTLDPEAVRRSAGRLAPDRWRERELFGPPSTALPEQLRTLIKPLEIALEAGNIRDGDHVCIAADDPVSLMPLHIARLGSGRCVDHLSLSLVTSFGEAATIADSPIVRPENALLVSMPVEEKRAEAKARAVDKIALSLDNLIGQFRRLEGPMAHETLLGTFEPKQLIHIDAHGFFPPERDGAFERAGLLVPQTESAMSRRGTADRILSSAEIHRIAPCLEGAHVTLNACVSGVALPGQGGDMLGLELALRLNGAASVMATYWDVRWPLSAEFIERFYFAWLREGYARGCAWRQAMLGAMADGDVIVSREEEWGAFGLYGDWR